MVTVLSDEYSTNFKFYKPQLDQVVHGVAKEYSTNFKFYKPQP